MNHFVFVVCGNREHTDTLNLSLNYLKHFSQSKIVVITDSSRNESNINHDHIIDVKTPEHYSHHEASIFLKTSLHHYLELNPENEFCYLDSDVVAVSKAVDDIFKFQPSPILFARDHCPFQEFSPMAINCDCHAKQVEHNRNFYQLINQFFPKDILEEDRFNSRDKHKLKTAFAVIKKRNPTSTLRAINYGIKRYLLPIKTFKFAGFKFNKHDRCWYNSNDKIIDIDFPYYSRLLKAKKGIWLDTKTNRWYNSQNEDITPMTPACEHLSIHINNKYGYNIPGNWRHWNGGVFRFNQKSNEFLNTWHKLTICEFDNPYTKTRDQGTLAVTAWKYKLQHIKTLPVKFNFITEYDKPETDWDPKKGYTFNGFKSRFEPAFLHIYHHWGDESWSIWQSVIDLGEK